MPSDSIQVHRTVERIESLGTEIRIGDWYRVTTQDHEGKDERWLGCVAHVGSNYAMMRSVESEHGGYSTVRVHFDEFDEICEPEPNAHEIIEEHGASATRTT